MDPIKLRKIGITVLVLGIVGFLVMFFAFFDFSFISMFLFIPIFPIFWIIGVVCLVISKNSFHKNIGTYLSKNCYEVEYYYKPNPDKIEDILTKSHLFEDISTYCKMGNNLIICRDNNYLSFDFKYYYYRRDSDGDTVEHTVFNGRLYKIDLGFTLDFDLCIRENQLNKSFKGLTLPKLDIDYHLFSDKFTVYTNDFVGAKNFLSSDVMDAIMNLELSYDGKFFISFIDGFCYVMISNNQQTFSMKANSAEQSAIRGFCRQQEVVDKVKHAFRYVK